MILWSLFFKNQNSAQWRPVTSHRQWAQSEIHEILFKCKKTLYWGWSNSGTGCLERLQHLHPWRSSGHNATLSNLRWLTLLWAGSGPRWSLEVPSSLSCPVILSFWFLKCHSVHLSCGWFPGLTLTCFYPASQEPVSAANFEPQWWDLFLKRF